MPASFQYTVRCDKATRLGENLISISMDFRPLTPAEAAVRTTNSYELMRDQLRTMAVEAMRDNGWPGCHARASHVGKRRPNGWAKEKRHVDVFAEAPALAPV